MQPMTNTPDDFAAAQAAFLASQKAGSNVIVMPRKEALLQDAADWLASGKPQEWIVDGLLAQSMVYAVTALTNHGKTAVSLNLALCVAGGVMFAGRTLKKGAVLILCGENPDGFRTRMKATMESLKLTPDHVRGNVLVLPQSMPLGAVRAQVREEAEKSGKSFSLVMVDTSVSFFTGDNEDDNLQARDHALDLRSLTELPGRPCVVVNCHPSKGATRDTLLPRGGGAFLNEIDTNLTVWSDGEIATLHWHHKKRGPDFDPICFEFQAKNIEEHGIKTPTVWAECITDAREDAITHRRRDHEDRLLQAMLRNPKGNYADWASECGWNGDKAKSHVFRVMNRLRDDKLVEKKRGKMVLSSLGKSEAERESVNYK